jgi:hypothetical protein
MRRSSLSVISLVLASALGCTTGEGEGWVKSEQLFVRDCWNGPFDLQPTFFGGNPHDTSLTIRVQRGDNLREVSDGVTIMIEDLPKLRESSLGSAVQIGLPATAAVSGPPVSLSVFLHASCHEQNGALYAVSGTITFASLFSGDPNESDADDRLTEASFSAELANAGDVAVISAGSAEQSEAVQTSHVEGWFRFFFQRGQPAQPFP